MHVKSTGLFLALLLVGAAGTAFAQFPAPPTPIPAPEAAAPKPRPAARPPAPPVRRPPKPGEVEMVPIKCWWKTDTTEVRMGQRFMLTLTCGVLETPSLKVTANTNALDPGALQVTPFEVASGVRREDIVSPPWRYFQYEYQVRLLNEGFFGQEVMLPSLSVTYNLQAASGGDNQGRDLTYALPGLPMRVASIVPRGATDIRDVSKDGFETIVTRRFRASVATVAGAILASFAAVFFAIAVARALGRVRRRVPAASKPATPHAVYGAGLATLANVKAEVARTGWSPVLVRRALAADRVAAAVGIGRAVAQAPAGRGAEREGQVLVRQGLVRRRRIMVSASTTSGAVERALADQEAPLRSRRALESLRSALQVLSVAAYGRSSEFDTIALDRAMSDSIDAVKQLRLRSLVPFGNGAAAEPTVAGLGSPSISGDRA
ncbi:MAG TPA: hypothetical protein VNN99_06820 [Vicinamibacterales bacterium]|nr:hypothetical protein [Vicinamibacterales bacterium]